MKPREEPIEVAGERGALRGIRHHPGKRDSGWTAVVLQGFFSCTHVGPSRLYVQLARRLARLGVEVLRLDCYGVGDSDGEFRHTSYQSEQADYAAILDHVRRADPRRRLLLVGHSLGANLAIRLAAADPRIERLLLVAPSCGAPDGRKAVFTGEQQAEMARSGGTLRHGVPISRSFVEAIDDSGVYEIARGVAQPSAIFFGEADEFYTRAAIDRLAAALPRAHVVSVPGGDHCFLARGSRPLLMAGLEREARRLPPSPGASYDRMGPRYLRKSAEGPYNALYERPALLDLVPPRLEGQQLLDAGCGPGLVAEQILARGAARLVALDASAAMLALARERLGRRAEYRQADLALPLEFLPDASLDGIVASLVLHYVERWDPLFAELARVLRPGGWLVFSTHHPFWDVQVFDRPDYFATERLDDDWDCEGEPVPISFYRRPLGEILRAPREAGFELDRIVEPRPLPECAHRIPRAHRELSARPAFLLVRAWRPVRNP